MEPPRLRAVFIGPENVGKTCLIRHLGTNEFIGEGLTLPSVGTAFTPTEIVASDGRRVTIGLWDTPGQTTYRDLMLPPLRNANFVVLVFDLTDRRTLANLRHYFDKAKPATPSIAHFFVLGNKSDLEADRSVTSDELQDYAERIHATGFSEVSAKTGDGIHEFRLMLADSAVQPRLPFKQISLQPPHPKEEKCGC
jgi:small GTP-binding protein